MKFEYIPSDLVCSKRFEFEIDEKEERILSCVVYGGCPGNLQGISCLLKGMKVKDAIARLDGISCGGKPTSCPDQIAQALKKTVNG